MWPSTALQALGVLVLLTVMTTNASEFGTPKVPGDIGHLGDERTGAAGYTVATTSTTTTDLEEYFKVNITTEKSQRDEAISSTSSTVIYTATEDASADLESKKVSSGSVAENLEHFDDPETRQDQLNEVAAGLGELIVENLTPDQWSADKTNDSNIPEVSELDTVQTGLVFDEILPPENARAISFQIPASNDENERGEGSLGLQGPAATNSEHKSVPNFLTEIKNPPLNPTENGKSPVSKDTYTKIVLDTINLKDKSNDRSRQQKNQLNPKATKAFYEIKSLLTTEAAVDLEDSQDPGAHPNVRKIILPTIPWMSSSMGKYGPYFEDGPEDKNITARIGSTVLLDCKIGMLHDKTVTWVQHSKDSIHLLTVARLVYSADQRVSLSFRYPSNWRLQILYASLRDSGLYECQVATHPPRIKKINLIVTAPVLTIVDDAGRVVAAGERHLKAGSVLKLSCEARDVREEEGESVVWTRGDETLAENVSENKTTESIGGKEVHVVVSTVSVDRATPRHAGNYSCSVPGRTRSTVAVHVLNGELPAAVHDGNGVSRAVLNLWLVHLTISYVFSR